MMSTVLLNNLLLVSVRPVSYGCTREVAKHERSVSLTPCSFSRALQLPKINASITRLTNANLGPIAL